MKTKYPLLAKFTSLLIATIGLAASAASAQTSIYYTSGSGATAPGGATLGGTLNSIGFDAYQTLTSGGVTNTTPGIEDGLMGASNDGFDNYFFHNYLMPGLPSTLGDGSYLSSVTLTMFVDAISPNTGIQTYEIYNGLSGLGGQAGLLNVPGNSGQGYFTFTISASVLSGGFSVGTLTENNLMNFATEGNSIAARTPLVVANYTIPEPSISLLGAVGALALLRRRRA